MNNALKRECQRVGIDPDEVERSKTYLQSRGIVVTDRETLDSLLRNRQALQALGDNKSQPIVTDRRHLHQHDPKFVKLFGAFPEGLLQPTSPAIESDDTDFTRQCMLAGLEPADVDEYRADLHANGIERSRGEVIKILAAPEPPCA